MITPVPAITDYLATAARCTISRCALAGAAAALLLSGALAPARAADEIRVVAAQSVSAGDLPAASGATHALRLNVYSFSGTRWSAEEIRAAVIESGRLLAQCGVGLTSVELRVLETPRRFHFYRTPVSRELARGIALAKPAVFFVEDTLNRPAFDAEAIGRANARSRPELESTVWVAYGARDLPYVLAHELVHVLSDSADHSTGPDNLMQSETSPRNVKLSDAQCERLRSRGEANGLLERR